MKKRITLLSFLLIICATLVFSQDKYSIDVKIKQRRVPVKYFVNESKTKFVEARAWRKRKRIENKTSKKIRKRTYRLQTKEVKKRMKRSEQKAQIFNRGKLPLSVKLRKLIYKWTS